MWDLAEGYKKRAAAAAVTKRKGKKAGSFRTPVFSVVAYDYGIKFNILRNLAEAGCRVKVVPAATPAEDVLALESGRHFSFQRSRRSRCRSLRQRKRS